MNRTDFRHTFGPWAVIAGASEGLGRAYAEALAARGLDILLLARRGEPLEAVATALRSAHGVAAHPVVLDLAADDVEAQLRAAVAGRDVGLLVYDAAATRIQPFADAPLDAHRRIVDVNCRGPVAACHVLVPGLRARGRGGIVLMSSMSSLQGSALIASYAASKAFNTILAESLWEELRHDGVHVLASIAGAVSTPSYRQNTPADKQRKAMPMTPEAVAAQTLDALARGRGPRFVPGRINRLVYVLSGLFGSRARTRFFSRATRDLYG